jgi:hypothetical protein
MNLVVITVREPRGAGDQSREIRSEAARMEFLDRELDLCGTFLDVQTLKPTIRRAARLRRRRPERVQNASHLDRPAARWGSVGTIECETRAY